MKPILFALAKTMFLGITVIGVTFASAAQAESNTQTGCGDVSEATEQPTIPADIQAQLDELQRQWDEGAYRGYNKYSGTSTTRSTLEKQLETYQTTLDKYLAQGEDTVAFTGAVSMSARAVKAGIAQAQEAGNAAAVKRGQKALATWQASVDKRIAALQKPIDRTQEVLTELRLKYRKERGAIMTRAGISPAPPQSLAMCRETIEDDGLTAAAVDPGEITDEPPTIMSLDDRIGDCMALEELQRDVCLANLALRSRSAKPCRAATDGRCKELVGDVAIAECQDQEPDADVDTCTMLVATWLDAPELCKQTVAPYLCVGQIAIDRADPDLILQATNDPVQQAIGLSSYILGTGDTSVIKHIEDNYLYDQTIVLNILILGARNRQTMPLSYCDQLRGNYTGINEDMEQETYRLCSFAVGINNQMLTESNMAETQEQLDQVRKRWSDALQRLTDGELDLDEFDRVFGVAPQPPGMEGTVE